MANVRNGNTWYVDTAGASLEVLNIRVSGIILTADTAAELLLGDSSSDAGYPNKISIKAAASTTEQIRLEDTPIIFPNSVRVKTLTSGAQATLILSTAGN